MVKNKALPDSARLLHCPPATPSGHSLSPFLSLSLADLALSRLVSRVFSLSLMPFILRVPPGSCRGWTLALLMAAAVASKLSLAVVGGDGVGRQCPVCSWVWAWLECWPLNFPQFQTISKPGLSAFLSTLFATWFPASEFLFSLG